MRKSRKSDCQQQTTKVEGYETENQELSTNILQSVQRLFVLGLEHPSFQALLAFPLT
jgi:hypothetical protein